MGSTAKTWRYDVQHASDLLKEASTSGSTWLDLMFADAKLQEAKEAITSALARLNSKPSVIEAKKHLHVVRTK